MLKKPGKFTGNLMKQRIGIAGACRGSGTTFCAMMTAYFLKKVKKRNTVVVERNLSGHLWSLGNEEPCFSVHGLDVYGKNTEDISAFDRYPCVILDYGTKITENAGLLPEFSKCTIKIITASLCEWKQEEFFQFIDTFSELPESGEFIYLAPLAQPCDIKTVKKWGNITIYPLAAEKSWNRIGPENLKLLEQLLC